MTATEIRAVVLRGLQQIAPEADLEQLPPGANVRESLDIDSFDFLNFLIGMNTELGVDIPESDCSRLTTLSEIVDYLATAQVRR